MVGRRAACVACGVRLGRAARGSPAPLPRDTPGLGRSGRGQHAHLAHGTEAMVAALERAAAFARWKAADVRSSLAAGADTPHPRTAGEALVIDVPSATGCSLAEYAAASPRESDW